MSTGMVLPASAITSGSVLHRLETPPTSPPTQVELLPSTMTLQTLAALSPAAEAIDKVVISEGQAALFAIGTSEYLFIQGGTAGTGDDGIVHSGNMSAKSLSDIGSAIEVTFSGIALDQPSLIIFLTASFGGRFFF